MTGVIPEVLIGVEITAQEADVFRKMREAGVFELRDGNATLHFSKTGTLLKLEKHTFATYTKDPCKETGQ